MREIGRSRAGHCTKIFKLIHVNCKNSNYVIKNFAIKNLDGKLLYKILGKFSQLCFLSIELGKNAIQSLSIFLLKIILNRFFNVFCFYLCKVTVVDIMQ